MEAVFEANGHWIPNEIITDLISCVFRTRIGN